MLQEGEYAGDYSIYSADSLKYWVKAFKGLYIAPNEPVQKNGRARSSPRNSTIRACRSTDVTGWRATRR